MKFKTASQNRGESRKFMPYHDSKIQSPGLKSIRVSKHAKAKQPRAKEAESRR